jgi:sugar lactone lactonase YvrE
MNRFWQTNLIVRHRLALILFIFLSCDGDDGPPADAPPAVISGISPVSGVKGTQVSISGDNFSTDVSQVQVFFNGKEASINSMTNTLITATVPPKAGSGTVKILVSGKETVGPVFSYIPTISVSTLAGDGTFGFVNGNGIAATFQSPLHLCADSKGNIFVADNNNHAIRKITPQGTVSTFAGNGTISGDIVEPNGICADKADNLYVTDACKIKKITPEGVVSILSGTQALSCGYADGGAGESMFSYPYGISTDNDGNLYVADRGAHNVRKISPGGTSSTLAGSSIGDENGTGSAAKFRYPHDLDIDAGGNIYVLDQSNFKIKKISPAGVVTTFVGGSQGHKNGTGTAAQLDVVSAICIEPSTGTFYFIERTQDSDSIYLRSISPEGHVITLLGTPVGYADGSPDVAKLNTSYGIAVDAAGSLYISENYPRIRKIVIE